MPPRENPSRPRETTERGLAIVGFLVLILFGIWVAFYASRFVPAAVNYLSTAAVSLTSVFQPGDATLSVVPTSSSTTLPFDTGTTTVSTPVITPAPTTVATAEPTPQPTPKPAAKPHYQAPSYPSYGSYPINGPVQPVPTRPALYGLPDLTVTILATGYLTGPSTNTFVPANPIPFGTRPAVKFTIQNVGTNMADSVWHFSASLPTRDGYVYYSDKQQALWPGDHVEYTLGFDLPTPGNGRSLSITVDSTLLLPESNENNNTATTQYAIANY